MAAKSIVDIEVNASDFEKFQKLFADYSAKLDEMPESWKKLNDAMGDASAANAAMAAASVTAKEALEAAGVEAIGLSVALAKAAKAQDALGNASHGTNKRMSELAKTAKGLASDIAGMGAWILRLGSGALAGLGVGAIVGGFGIGELANSAFNRSRTASGYGLSPGQLASFNVNAQRYFGSGALGAAASAPLDYKNAADLSMLGIDFNRAQGMNAADLAFEALRNAAKLYKTAGRAPGSNPLVQAFHRLGFGDIEDVRRAANDPGGLNAAQSAYRRDIGSLGFDQQTAKAWTDFKVQLDRAGLQIETVFINKLGPLVPEFTQLSKDAISAIAAFVNSKDFGKTMASIKDGLKNFLGWLEGPDAKKLADNLNLVADEVFAVAQKLKWLIPANQAAGLPPEPGHSQGGFGKPGSMSFDALNGVWRDASTGSSYDPMSGTWTDKNGNTYDSKSRTWKQPLFNSWGSTLGSWWKNLTTFSAGSGAMQNAMLNAISGQESSGNAGIMNRDGSGAMGRYQFMPGTADEQLGDAWVKKYGSTTTAKGRANFLGSPAAQTRAAFAYLAELEKVALAKHLKGAEFIKGVAEGWYGGPNAVGNPNISGGTYNGHTYKTTGQYSIEVLQRLIKALMLQQSHGTKVSIVNSTAARVAVSVNATATG